MGCKVKKDGKEVLLTPKEFDLLLLFVQNKNFALYKETIYEIPAGKLEYGENPRDAAIREFSEECGASAEIFESLGEIYPTPGYCGEIIRIFYAAELSYGEQHLDDDEYLDVIKMPFEECVSRIMSGEIKDAKTIAGILKLKELKRL